MPVWRSWCIGRGNLITPWYGELIMPLPGYAVLLFLLALAKAARRFDLGPQWLRRFTIGKSTYY